MPRGDKSAYSDKQKRQAEHIEKSYEHKGTSKHEAERRAWATVNKETGGGKKSGSGRKPSSGAKSATKKASAASKKTPVRKVAKKNAGSKTTKKKSAR
jgi:plasmid stabilization system protein ParE